MCSHLFTDVFRGITLLSFLTYNTLCCEIVFSSFTDDNWLIVIFFTDEVVKITLSSFWQMTLQNLAPHLLRITTWSVGFDLFHRWNSKNNVVIFVTDDTAEFSATSFEDHNLKCGVWSFYRWSSKINVVICVVNWLRIRETSFFMGG